MSLIMAKSLGNFKYRVFCEGCGQEVCIVGASELADMAHRGVRVFCFGCDGVNADCVPQVLLGDDLEYLLKIDGQWFLVNWPNLARHQGERVAYYQAITKDLFDRLALATAVAGQSLSSSTYLHENGLENGPMGGEGKDGNEA